MSIASITSIGTSLVDAGSKTLGAVSSLGTGTLAIGSGISVAVTALSVGMIVGGRTLYSQNIDKADGSWQKTLCKVGGMSLMILGGLLGLASSVATGMFSSFSLAALGTAVLGPVGTQVGVIAGIALGIASTTTVIVALVKCLKERNTVVRQGLFGDHLERHREDTLV